MSSKLYHPGGRINIKMWSYQYRKSHWGDKTILRPSYLHNGISYTGKKTSLYWIRALDINFSHPGITQSCTKYSMPRENADNYWIFWNSVILLYFCLYGISAGFSKLQRHRPLKWMRFPWMSFSDVECGKVAMLSPHRLCQTYRDLNQYIDSHSKYNESHYKDKIIVRPS